MRQAKAKLRRVCARSVMVAFSVASCACSSDQPARTQDGDHTGQASGAGGMLAAAGAGSPIAGAGSTSGGQPGASGGAGANTGAGSAAVGGNSGAPGSGGNGGHAGAGGAVETPGPFELTSPAFSEGGLIDVKFRCTGDNVTPELHWSSGPAGTRSYAVTQIHVGSQSLHWVMWDISADTRMLPQGIAREATPATPAGAKQVKPNIDGSTWYGYSGPCPGSANQSYTFSVYALDVLALPGVTPESTSTAADAAIKTHQLAAAHLSGMASK